MFIPDPNFFPSRIQIFCHPRSRIRIKEFKYFNPNKWFSQLSAGLWIRINFSRIRIQSLRLETNPDPDPIRIQGFNDQKLKKITAEIFFYIFFLIKTAIYLSLGLHKVQYVQVIEEAFSSQKRPSNTSKHELLQIFVYFCGSFLPSWIRIRNRIPNPDPQTRLNTDPIRIRIRIHNSGSRKYDPGCSMFIPDTDPDFLPIPDPASRVKKSPDPGSGSATLANTNHFLFRMLVSGT
jgi:hypothetical protein